MKVRLTTNNLNTTGIVENVRNVVILDDNDQPMVLASMTEAGIYHASAEEPTFFEKLKDLGLMRRTMEVLTKIANL